MPQAVAATRAFRRLLLRSVVLPVMLMALLAGVLVWQIARLRSNAQRVERIDQTISRLHLLEKFQIDMETGLRGFLNAGTDDFLEPYANARAKMPPLLAEAAAMLVDQPAAAAALDDIRERSRNWTSYAEAQIARRRADAEWQQGLVAGEGKRLMDDLRRRFESLTDAQVDVRAQRNAQTERLTVASMAGAGGLAILIGVAMSLLSRGQLRSLSEDYERALGDARSLSAELERRVDARTRELSDANGKLNENNRELEAFAHSISHDLRAPMRHISGFANLVRSSAGARMDPGDLENLETIHATAVLAGRMVDDLLSFSRVGRARLRVVAVDMNGLVRDCLKGVSPETSGREIEWQVAPLEPTRGDPSLLRMAFQNLIANAVKYTGGRAHARIEISGRPEGDGVTYVVRDNGVGFDMAYVHKLFGVFQRLHRAEDFEGTGIGLANVRRIITRHGGQVWAEGIPDVGAAFYVHLPNAPAPTEPPGVGGAREA